MSTGGSIQSISINRRLFAVTADADSNRDLGGFTVEISSNGDGSARQKKTRKPWKLDGVTVQIDNNRSDLEFLQDFADGADFGPIVISYVDGNSYSGVGKIVGDIQASSDNATADLSFSGPFKLEKQ